jgi:hypothetical protein
VPFRTHQQQALSGLDRVTVRDEQFGDNAGAEGDTLAMPVTGVRYPGTVSLWA